MGCGLLGPAPLPPRPAPSGAYNGNGMWDIRTPTPPPPGPEWSLQPVKRNVGMKSNSVLIPWVFCSKRDLVIWERDSELQVWHYLSKVRVIDFI